MNAKMRLISARLLLVASIGATTACTLLPTSTTTSDSVKDYIYTQVSISDSKENQPEDLYRAQCEESTDKSELPQLYITIPKSKLWYKRILKARLETGLVIHDKYKKPQHATLAFSDLTGSCQIQSRLRISGDWKDHLQVQHFVPRASIDLRLLDGGFRGATRYKLFLPNTKGEDGEIFIATLMRKLGFISPRTFYVTVKINNDEPIKYIAQEKPAKELLEFNQLRESAILESDERQFWRSEKLGITKDDLLYTPKITNSSWLMSNHTNQQISRNAYVHMFKPLLEASISNSTYSDFLLSGDGIANLSELKNFRMLMSATYSAHALNNHNRKFYYDPMLGSLRPIYYDGNTFIMDERRFSYPVDRSYLSHLRGLTSRDAARTLRLLRQLDLEGFALELKSSGLLMSKEEVAGKIDEISTRVLSIKNLLDNQSLPRAVEPDDTQLFASASLWFKKNALPKLCQLKVGLVNNIEPLGSYCGKSVPLNSGNENSYYIQMMLGRLSQKGVPYLFVPINTYLSNLHAEKYLRKIKDLPSNVSIYATGRPSLSIDAEKRRITIVVRSNADRVMFHGGVLVDWFIEIKSPPSVPTELQTRYDESLLTSTVTFSDMEVIGLNLRSYGGLHEDAINFLRASGSIDSVIITKSRQDAIDLDFSELRINRLKVEDAGNDCLDASSGKYSIAYADLVNCSDKAVSLGEKSIAYIEGIKVNRSTVGIAVKDSSALKLVNARLYDVGQCLALYRKKPEFTQPSIRLRSIRCDQMMPSFVQHGSEVSRF